MDQNLNSESRWEASWSNPSCSISAEAIRSELQRILASRTFRAAQGQKKFLAYTVEEVLAGNAHLLKEYVIATDALGRKASFDPRLDPIVRTEARKLRAKLAKYYETEGNANPLRIEFRKGSYAPFFQDTVSLTPELPSEPNDTETPTTASAIEVPSAFVVPLIPDTDIHPPQPHWKRPLASVAVLVLVICATVLIYHLSHSGSSETIFASDDASIAVLPLVNLSNSNEEFLSDGLTEELINSLRQVPGLQVVARTSAFRFKAKTFDIREIDEKLHVRTVLLGSFSRSEHGFKVAVQLNNAENGYHLWSGSYERDSADIGTIPPEIAGAVVNVLRAGPIRGGRSGLIQMSASPNSGAHQDYLRGLYFRNRYTSDSLTKAIEYFKQAIAQDPSFAQAYAGLADCYAMARPVFATPPLEVIPKIEAAASKALELNPKLGEPHIDLAVNAEYEFDWATAEREFKKGLELSPGNVLGHIWYAWYLALAGRRDEVLTQRTIAARLDPVSPYAVDSVGRYYSAIGHYETAVEQYRSALTLDPNFGLAHQDLGDAYLLKGMCPDAIEELLLANESMPGPRRRARLGYAYAVCGHIPEARRILHDFLNEPRRSAIPALAIAEIYLGLGDKDQTFTWLEKAVDERDLDVGLKLDAQFESLRSDPRFNNLLRRMKLI